MIGRVFFFFLLPSPNPGLHRLHRVTTGCIKVLQSTLAESCSLSLKTTNERKYRQTAAVIIKSNRFIYFPQLSHAHVQVLHSSPCSVLGTPHPTPTLSHRPPCPAPRRPSTCRWTHASSPGWRRNANVSSSGEASCRPSDGPRCSDCLTMVGFRESERRDS